MGESQENERKWKDFLEFLFDVGTVPKIIDDSHRYENFYANFTNMAYPLTATILLAAAETPVLALGVTFPGIMSSVYHGVGYISDQETLVQGLMVMDVLSILVGISVGLWYNSPPPSPGWLTLFFIMLWEAGVFVVLNKADHKWHWIWHLISVAPVLSYAFNDIGKTAGSENHPEDIEGIALGFLIVCWLTWAASLIFPILYFQEKEVDYDEFKKEFPWWAGFLFTKPPPNGAQVSMNMAGSVSSGRNTRQKQDKTTQHPKGKLVF